MRPFFLAVSLLTISNIAALAEDWREFRGPTGQGLYAGKGLPIEWSPTQNVVWKTPIAGHGWSSPVVQEGRVYLTSAVPIANSKDLSLQVICLDAANAKQFWATEAFRQDANTAPRIHSKNSHASPTPITDGKRLYVHFGHQGTACLNLDGSIVWKNCPIKYQPVHGNGGTPILVENRLIFSIDGTDKQLVVALDSADGKIAWQTDRKSTAAQKFSFSTPLAINVNGKTQIVSPGSDVVSAYDPADGTEIWRVQYTGYSVIPRPVFGHGMIFMSTGYNTPSVLAIKVDGKDDVTNTHVVWKVSKGAPNTPSLLLVEDELYMVSDKGLASCLDARTGKVHWQNRVADNDGYSASPFYAEGKVYFQSEAGMTTVVKAGKTFEILARSKLNERTFACYAAADRSIYLRSEKHLYRLQVK